MIQMELFGEVDKSLSPLTGVIWELMPYAFTPIELSGPKDFGEMLSSRFDHLKRLTVRPTGRARR